MIKTVRFILLALILVISGCQQATEEQHNTESSYADYLSIGNKDYIHAWELTVVDSSKLVKFTEVEKAYRLPKGSDIYEIKGYPERNIVAVKDDSPGVGIIQNITGFSIYVRNEGSGGPSYYPDLPASQVQQIQVYKDAKLIHEWQGTEAMRFIDLFEQQGASNEFQYDRVPQYTVLFKSDNALGKSYGIIEKDGEYGLAHTESQLPKEIAGFFEE